MCGANVPAQNKADGCMYASHSRAAAAAAAGTNQYANTVEEGWIAVSSALHIIAML